MSDSMCSWVGSYVVIANRWMVGLRPLVGGEESIDRGEGGEGLGRGPRDKGVVVPGRGRPRAEWWERQW